MKDRKILTGEDYIQSLRGRKLKVFLMGEQVNEPVDHPVMRPSINAMARTYDLALEESDLATAMSPFTGERVNRFLHIATNAEEVVLQNKMQRRLGQLTGTCFQRCVGMDALNALYSVTYEIDAQRHTSYHARLKEFIQQMQYHNTVIGGAMTDVKGDRSKPPSQQADPDMYLHISKRTKEGVYIRGAKAHQTGCINSHWLIVMPTLRLQPDEVARLVRPEPLLRLVAVRPCRSRKTPAAARLRRPALRSTGGPATRHDGPAAQSRIGSGDVEESCPGTLPGDSAQSGQRHPPGSRLGPPDPEPRRPRGHQR